MPRMFPFGFSLGRRHVMAGGGATTLAAMASSPPAAAAGSAAMGKLPPRERLLIRNGYVMTMEPGEADMAHADVLIENGQIKAIGHALPAQGAKVIDATGYIVMPGLVDTHWHTWTTLLRNMSGDDKAHGYFPMTTVLGKYFNPRDMYLGTALSAAEAVHSGITTLNDWCHNVITHEHALQDLRALQDAGLRARFSYGPARATPLDKPINIADLESLQKDWAHQSNDGLITLGLAWRGVQAALPDGQGGLVVKPLSEAMWRTEYDAARRLGLPISVHLNSTPPDKDHIGALQRMGMLFDGLQVIHAITSTPEEMKMLADAGGSCTMSPASELRIGFGVSRISDWIASGAQVSLSVDTTPLTGNADMFGIMKLAQNIANGVAGNEFKLPARRVLELATIKGAQALGLGDRTGSLKPGKRADVIMVDTQAVNMGPFTAPDYMLVDSAQAANVDTVIIDGRVLKRAGKLTAINVPQLMLQATQANQAIRQRANWV